MEGKRLNAKTRKKGGRGRKKERRGSWEKEREMSNQR